MNTTKHAFWLMVLLATGLEFSAAAEECPRVGPAERFFSRPAHHLDAAFSDYLTKGDKLNGICTLLLDDDDGLISADLKIKYKVDISVEDAQSAAHEARQAERARVALDSATRTAASLQGGGSVTSAVPVKTSKSTPWTLPVDAGVMRQSGATMVGGGFFHRQHLTPAKLDRYGTLGAHAGLAGFTNGSSWMVEFTGLNYRTPFYDEHLAFEGGSRLAYGHFERVGTPVWTGLFPVPYLSTLVKFNEDMKIRLEADLLYPSGLAPGFGLDAGFYVTLKKIKSWVHPQ